jgi:hypothetical protein
MTPWVSICVPSSRTWRVQRRRRSDQPIWRTSLPSTLIVRIKHPVGNPKRKVWWAEQQVSLSCETMVYQTSRRKSNFWRWCLLASRYSGQRRQKNTCRREAFHQQQRGTCTQHNQELCPNLRWGCQSHWFTVNKGLSVLSGKR